jgi:hypothetical protein
MRLTVFSRGGFSVYGGGAIAYDPHTNEAVISARDGETVTLTIEYPSAPTSPTTSGDGISATTPVITDNTITTTLSGITEAGSIDITATVGGEAKTIRIRGVSPSDTERYPC